MSISINDLTGTINSGFKFGGGSFQIGYINHTSNILINYTSNTSNSLSDLIKNTNNNSLINTNNFNISNLILSNTLYNNSLSNSNNLSDFIKYNSNISLSNSNNLLNYSSNLSNSLYNNSLTNSNNLSDFIINTSNQSLTNSNNLSDFIINTSNQSLTNSNNLNNFIINTSNKFNSINTDTIIQGTSNRFIVNDIYNRNITFTNTLYSSNITTSNLNVIGDTTTFNTTIYQTEQLQVVNDTTATAMIVKQVNSNKNVAEFYYQNNLSSLILSSNGNIGIGIANPLNKLDVNGNINTSNLFLSGINIQTLLTNTSNNLITQDTFNSNNLINHILYTSNILASSSSSLLSTGGTITGQLSLSSTSNITPLYITSTATSSTNAIQIKNNTTSSAYIGIAGTTYGGNYQNNLFIQSPNAFVLNINGGGTSSTPNIFINTSGNVGIGTNNPTTIFQIGNSGRLRISNGITDYSLLGTIDIDNNTSNTKIFLNGSNCTYASAPGSIQYFATSTGSHIFYTGGANEKMRIDSSGLITTSGNIDCGGGISINGSTAFFANSPVDAGNLTNTYINFKYAGTDNDWCYLRQIGGANEYKLALDFHDDGTEGRFCIRSIQSTATPDTITEVFTVDNGNVYCTGNMGVGTNAPPVKFYVSGDIASTGDITAYYSDIRLKDIHSNINNPLDIINNLNGFYYTPNELAKSLGINKNKMEIGLSAQDVQKVLPELVNIAPFDMMVDEDGKIISKSGNNYLTISYERIVPILIEGIKEQNKKISNLENEINEIKKIYSKLLTKFE
jgi:hypothetical protein